MAHYICFFLQMIAASNFFPHSVVRCIWEKLSPLSLIYVVKSMSCKAHFMDEGKMVC